MRSSTSIPFSYNLITDIYIVNAIEKIINGKKILAHVLFCLIVLILFYTGTWFLNVAGFKFGDVPLVFARFSLFLLCIYTGRWLCEKWYLNNKLLPFSFFTTICCFIIALLWWLIIKIIFNNPDAGFIEVLISALPFFIVGVILGVLLKLTRTTIKKQVHDAQAAASQKQSELNLLQSQLSPHFLFNTLNNLYGISIAHQERVPKLLLKLSELLRYSVYDTKKPFVSLNDELAYITNYIDFERIRISDRLILQNDIEDVSSSSFMIAPMVLIVFIENAFKHAKNTLEKKIKITISLKIVNDLIIFSVVNSYDSLINKNNIANEHSGLGVANTVKRLELLYGGDYTLKQVVENDKYITELILKQINREYH